MALQIRRGTDAERQLYVPLQGEIIFTIDTKKLYVGDGVTLGGIIVDSGTGGGGGTAYSISAETVSGGANLTLTGADSSTDSVKIAAGTNVTVERTDANTITINASGVGGASNLTDLADVSVSEPSTGQVLKYNGTAWVNGVDSVGSGDGAATLDELENVLISDVTEGQKLTYNGTLWVNQDSVESLVNLEDIDITEPEIGQILKYNGVKWFNQDVNENNTMSIGSLIDVETGGSVENSNLRLVNDIWSTRTDLVGSKVTVNTAGNGVISLEISHTDNNDSSGIVDFIKSRGTDVSRTAVLPGDSIFSIQGRGYDGTDYYPVAAIRTFADPAGSISTGVIPGSLALFTADSTGVLQRRLEIDKDGLIYTTGILGAKQFYIYSDDTRPYSLTSNHSSSTAASANQFNFQKSRGTDLSPSIVTAGDSITNLAFKGYDGSSYRTSSAIISTVDPEGVVSGTAIPGRLGFWTAGDSGALVLRAELDKNGKFTTYGQHWGVTGVPTGLPLLLIANSNATSDGARSAMRRSRGTFTSPTAVINGDRLFRLMWGGHDGSAYIDSASIEATVSAAVSTGIIPTELAIRTTNSSGVLTTAIKVTNNQVMQVNTISSLTAPAVSFSSAVRLANYANAGARDTAIPSPQAGTVVYITDTGKFQGYNGLTSTWNDLN